MMRHVLSNLKSVIILPNSRRRSGSTFQYNVCRFFSDRTVNSDSSRQTAASELPRVDSLVEGCDYNHWLVVMHPPDNYPQREEIVQQYVVVLAMALGSERAAMESIYSVSTKYYYAFGCEVAQNVANKIKSLPRVKWVLPDSHLSTEESGYGGEPYVDGKVVPYEDKYHADWLRGVCDEDCTEGTSRRKEEVPERRY